MSGIAIGKDVQQVYEQIVGGDKSVTWAVFSYEGQTELRLQASGADDLSEFPDEFSDGKLQYAFLRLLEPNSKLPKFVLVGWCGDGAPRKGVFQQHFSSVASKLTGYHVQITARDEEDVSEASMMKKVEDASGAKYSQASSGSVFGPTTSKKPTTNSLVSQLKGQSSPGFSSRKPTQTEPRLPPSASIKPSVSRGPSYANNRQTEDWDVPKTNVHGKIDKSPIPAASNENRPEPVKSSYQPIGRPDINALRAQAPSDNPSLASSSTENSYKPVEVPKTGSLSDRMSAFTGSNNNTTQTSPSSMRKASNPLASRFGGAIGGTKPAVPTSGPRESRAIGGLAKNFGSEDGKTPAQLWAERKARERGESIPEPIKEAPVKATTYDDESAETSRGGVSSIRDKFAATSIEDEVPASKPVSLPPPPSMPTRADSPDAAEEEDEPEIEPVATNSRMPPPPNMNSRPAASSTPVPPPAPVPQHEPEDEQEEEEEEQIRTESPEPAPVQNSFKSQLEKTIGGGGSTAAAASSSNAPKEHASSSAPRAKALYEYEAQEDNELTLEEGELVTDIEMIDEGWWSGKNRSGQTGLFPSNYVELVEDDDDDAGAAPAAPHAAAAAASSASTHRGSGLCATAIYEYEAAEEGEVGFEEGEMIEEIEQIDEGWWQGKNARGEQGLFPSNYVELIQ